MREGYALSSAFHSYCLLIHFTVIGYTEETRAQTIDEGEGSNLVVAVLKPPAGVGQVFLVEFQIDNSANTGKMMVLLAAEILHVKN